MHPAFASQLATQRHKELRAAAADIRLALHRRAERQLTVRDTALTHVRWIVARRNCSTPLFTTQS